MIILICYYPLTDNPLPTCSHPRGRPRLLKAISSHYSPQFENLTRENRQLRPEEIVVTAGANEGEPEECSSNSSNGIKHLPSLTLTCGFESVGKNRNVRRSSSVPQQGRRSYLY